MELLNREEVTPAVVRPLENSSSMVCPKNVLDSGVIKGIQQVLKLKKKKNEEGREIVSLNYNRDIHGDIIPSVILGESV